MRAPRPRAPAGAPVERARASTAPRLRRLSAAEHSGSRRPRPRGAAHGGPRAGRARRGAGAARSGTAVPLECDGSPQRLPHTAGPRRPRAGADEPSRRSTTSGVRAPPTSSYATGVPSSSVITAATVEWCRNGPSGAPHSRASASATLAPGDRAQEIDVMDRHVEEVRCGIRPRQSRGETRAARRSRRHAIRAPSSDPSSPRPTRSRRARLAAEAVVLGHDCRSLVASGGGCNRGRVHRRRRERLLDDDVTARCECGLRELAVRAGRRGDQDGIRGDGSECALELPEYRHTERLSRPPPGRCARVDHSGQPEAAGRGDELSPAPAPEADADLDDGHHPHRSAATAT